LMVEQRAVQSLLITILHLVVIALLLPLLSAGYGALGAAWAVVVAAGAGALGSLLIIYKLQNRVGVPRLGLMLLASAGSVLVAAVTPIAWPLQLLVGAAIYVLLIWVLGVVLPKDFHALLRAMRPAKPENYG
jgi:hypothetical protein